MTATATNIHDEITQILQLYINCNLDEKENIEDIEECTQKIIEVINKDHIPKKDFTTILDKKIEYCNQCKKDPIMTMNENSWDCMDAKIQTFLEIKEMLNKK